MKITCVADLHSHYPELPGGDLLIVAGDLTRSDKPSQYLDFFTWIAITKYRKRIVVAGNHDGFIEKNREIFDMISDFTYLQDSGTEFDGLKIWGSPWTKSFKGINPHCKAFTVDHDDELDFKWEAIPQDVDILVTHSPPQSCLDFTIIENKHVITLGFGSLSLQKRYNKISPKLHVFGHIHEGYGKDRNSKTIFINSSHVNERYEPVNPPITVNM